MHRSQKVLMQIPFVYHTVSARIRKIIPHVYVSWAFISFNAPYEFFFKAPWYIFHITLKMKVRSSKADLTTNKSPHGVDSCRWKSGKRFGDGNDSCKISLKEFLDVKLLTLCKTFRHFAFRYADPKSLLNPVKWISHKGYYGPIEIVNWLGERIEVSEITKSWLKTDWNRANFHYSVLTILSVWLQSWWFIIFVSIVHE